MSGQEVPRSVEQRIVIKFLVGENVPSAEIHHRLQQQYGEECLRILNFPNKVKKVAGLMHGCVSLCIQAEAGANLGLGRLGSCLGR